jgi:hypothetical protein
MRPSSSDAIIREQWLDENSSILRQPPDPVRAARSITAAPAASAAPSLDASERYEARFAAWERRLEEALDDDIENGGDGGLTGADIAPWLAASILEMVDQAVASVLEKTRIETGALRRSLEVERERRTADRRRHVEERGAMCARIADIEGKLANQEKAHAEDCEQWRDELRLLSAELAEQRAVADLRHSRAGRSHSAKVQMRLLRRDLEQEAKGAA